MRSNRDAVAAFILLALIVAASASAAADTTLKLREVWIKQKLDHFNCSCTMSSLFSHLQGKIKKPTISGRRSSLAAPILILNRYFITEQFWGNNKELSCPFLSLSLPLSILLTSKPKRAADLFSFTLAMSRL